MVSPRSDPLFVRVSGPLALFTRPEMKVERVSYEFITPSAARGVLEAILWKPAMRWVVRRLKVLNPIRFVPIKRNEVASKIPSTFKAWAARNEVDRAFYADDDRQQRNAQVLRDVDYVIEASIELTAAAGPEDSITKFVEIFRRRVSKGQHFHQPYLGCREFPATVALARGDERPHPDLIGQETDHGWMLHDILYQDGRAQRPLFFQATMRDGTVEIPDSREEVAS